jgi:hypothetical protein
MGTGSRPDSAGSSNCFGGGGGTGGGTGAAGIAGVGVAGVTCANCDCSAGWVWAQAARGRSELEKSTAAATTADIHGEAFMALPPSLTAGVLKIAGIVTAGIPRLLATRRLVVERLPFV